MANATLAVSGADASVDWSDLLLKADGPELLRRPARASENEVLSWVREWATLWTKKGDNARRLTTPVDVVPTPNGAELVFVDKRAPKRSKAGGVRLVVEAVDGVRVRAVRGAYSEGIAVKAMSEDLILARLGEDLPFCIGVCQHRHPDGSVCGALLDPKGRHARACGRLRRASPPSCAAGAR